MKRLATAMLLLGIAPNVFAGVFEITLDRVAGGGNIELCRGVAEELASAFAQQTSTTIIDYGCRPEEFVPEWIEAVLTYQAPERLSLVSTFTPTTDALDFYANRSDCLAQLEHQKEVFASATGVPPLVAYCMLSTSRWRTRVEGIGVSEVRADTASVNFSGDLLDQERVAADYEIAASAFGLTIFEKGISFGAIGKKFVMRFYGDDAYSINDYDRLVYRSPEDCLTGAVLVRSMLEETDKPAVVFCDRQRNGGQSRLHATTFRKTIEGNPVFEGRTLTRNFSSLPACQTAADAIGASSDDIFGAVCSGAGGTYNVHLFVRP